MTGEHVTGPFVHVGLPWRVVFGVGALDRVSDEVAELGAQRVLVIASGSASAAADTVVDHLGDRVASQFGEVRQHVPQPLADRALTAADACRADALLCVGGGSAIGLGKAVAVRSGRPLVAVPTTYSGSEMTPVHGVTGTRKTVGSDLRALPRVSVYDPRLTVALPPRVTAASGCNAVAHCVQALRAPTASPILRLLAGEGLRLLADSLPRCVRTPDNLAARTNALYGACLAGAALAGAGTGLHHKLCHALGGSYDLVHADAHAVLLPHAAAFTVAAEPRAQAALGAAVGSPDPVRWLWDLTESVGAPASLAELGLPEDGLDVAAEQVAAEIAVDQSSVRALLDDAYHGRRPAPVT